MLLIGLVVAALSLRTSNVQEIYAAGPETTIGLSTDLINADMPGSLPYTAARGWERAQQLWLSDPEKVTVYLTRIADRRESAEMAWQAGKSELAITTYFKAYGYLDQLKQLCTSNTELCQGREAAVALATDQLTESLRRYAGQADNDMLRAKVDGLLARI